MKGFKQFLLRGNAVDLAVGVVIGAAFGAVVNSMVKGLLTPFIAAVVKQPDFSSISFTINGSKLLVGDFINALVSFVIIAAAVYFASRAADKCASGAGFTDRRSPSSPAPRSVQNASAKSPSPPAGAPIAPSPCPWTKPQPQPRRGLETRPGACRECS